MGADTARPLLRRLVPEAAFIARPRLSTLRYVEPKKLDRLPRRSAVVVFSMADVYAVAERLRREGGGAAVVFGALSPRTRNAQVALYQAGEVDHLVATDAIGMGLNLDIDHVTFTGLVKFDGRAPRPLTPAEVAQIAGRAGRHTAGRHVRRHVRPGRVPARPGGGDRVPPLPSARPLLLAAVGPRLLEPARARREPGAAAAQRRRWCAPPRPTTSARWTPWLAIPRCGRWRGARSTCGCCGRCARCRTSATSSPTPTPGCSGASSATCAARRRRLPEDWVASQVRALDRLDGNTDALLARLAAIRTWTYLAHRDGWVAGRGPLAGAGEAGGGPALGRAARAADRAVRGPARRDRLARSAGRARHERGRGGRRRRAGPACRPAGGLPLRARRRGERGLARRHRRRQPRAAWRRGRRSWPRSWPRATRRSRCAAEGRIAWRGADVARLGAGDAALAPRVESAALRPARPAAARARPPPARRVAGGTRGACPRTPGDAGAGGEPQPRGARAAVRAGGGAWLRAPTAGGSARQAARDGRPALARATRRPHRPRGGVRAGPRFTRRDRAAVPSCSRCARAAAHWIPGGPSVAIDATASTHACAASGYVTLGPRALRADVAERVAQRAFELAQAGRLEADAAIAALAGAAIEEVPGILKALGYVPDAQGRFAWRRHARSRPKADVAS